MIVSEAPCVFSCNFASQCLEAMVGAKYCTHIEHRRYEYKSAPPFEIIVHIENSCLNYNGTSGNQCGRSSENRVSIIARQLFGIGGKRRQTRRSVFVTGKVTSLDPRLLKLVDANRETTHEFRFSVSPYQENYARSASCLGIETFRISLEPQLTMRYPKLKIQFEFSVEDYSDAMVFGVPTARSLGEDSIFASVTLPPLANVLSTPLASLSLSQTEPPMQSIGDGIHQVNDDIETVLNELSELHSVELSPIRVVGGYVRWEDDVRSELKRRMLSIKQNLADKAPERSNYLIWGPSGSGKSFFVQELARSLTPSVYFDEINVLKLDENNAIRILDEKLSSIDLSKKQSILFFVDEIDGDAGRFGIYQQLCDKLDDFAKSQVPVVCVGAGSTKGGMTAMNDVIRGLHRKGDDLLTRFPVDYRFNVPQMKMRDQVAVFGSQIINLLKKRGDDVGVIEIEKLALFWILMCEDYRPARQVADLAAVTVRRIQASRPIYFEQLYDLGSDISRLVLGKYQSVVNKLGKSMCRVSL